VAGFTLNAILLRFNTSGIDVDDAETFAHCGAPPSVDPRLVLGTSIVFGSPSLYDTDVDGAPGDPTAESACTAAIRTVNPALIAPTNPTAPDFRPQPGSPARSGHFAPPNDGFFESVTYVGGVAPDVPQFFQGWAQFPVN
jgi:hypothetical protein